MEIAKISLLGSGGLGHEIAAIIMNNSYYEFCGFYDDNNELTQHDKHTWLGTIDDLKNTQRSGNFLISIGDPVVKKNIVNRLSELKLDYPVLLHRLCHIEDVKSVFIDEGSIITSGVNITCNVKIGKHVLINLNSTIGHDVQIGDYSSIMPGAHISGSVTIGKGVLVGSGAVILQNIKIGDGAKIGAGAVVTKDVKENAVVVGIPASPTS